jgi:hypothetical protein
MTSVGQDRLVDLQWVLGFEWYEHLWAAGRSSNEVASVLKAISRELLVAKLAAELTIPRARSAASHSLRSYSREKESACVPCVAENVYAEI